MSERRDGDREHRVTTDPERIREWGQERNAVPASRESSPEDGTEYGFFREGNVHDDYREHEWDEFLDRFGSEDRAFVYRENETLDDDDIGHYEIIDRDEAAARATVEDREVEDELLSGGTVTTEVTETTVVEREIVEHETIESEVVDREIVRSRITDAELVDWEVSDPDVDFDLRADENIEGSTVLTTSDGRAQYDEIDLDTTIDGDITAEVDETWRLRREVDEQAIVESEVVDTDVEETDHVEDESVETTIDTEGVHRSLVENDVLETNRDADELIETDVIETERTGEGRMESRLVQRTVYDDRIRRRKRIRFEYVGGEVIDTETLDSDVVESDVVDVEYDEDATVVADEDAGAATAAAADSDAEAYGETTTADAADSDAEAYGETTTADAADSDAEAYGETTTADASVDETLRSEIREEDRGKTVIDEEGDEVGQVSRVEGGVAYVEPHAGFFERIESMLGMGNDDDEYPLNSAQVLRVTDDDVVISDEAEERIEADAENDYDRDDR